LEFSAAVNGVDRPLDEAPVAAVVTICTGRKRLKAVATPAILTAGAQAAVSQGWRAQLVGAPARSAARDLYTGRGFGLAKLAAELANSPLFIVSAGLGLVMGDTIAPAYGLTISRGHEDSISSKVVGGFDATAWFADLLTGPYSSRWSHVTDNRGGRVLIAVTRPYAELVAESLSALAPEALGRLRIFGAGLSDALPACLSPFLLPYDDRLDTLFPGTKSDFAQRAMLHFVQYIADQPADCVIDCNAVTAALNGVEAPARPSRAQRTDDEILTLIAERLGPGASASRLLRTLRDRDGIACEQNRFAKLFRAAVARREAV
jgi:hypothetical protein